MKNSTLVFAIFFCVFFNFVTTFDDSEDDPTDPKVCGLQPALDGVWLNYTHPDGGPVPWFFKQYLGDPRYTFYANENKCKRYNRGGIGNNDNSFTTKKLCQKLCQPWNEERGSGEDDYNELEDDDPKNPDVCGLQTALDGVWRVEFGKLQRIQLLPLAPRYSFDANKNDCKKYNRGGWGNNANNFFTKKKCLNLCRPWNYKRGEVDLPNPEEH